MSIRLTALSPPSSDAHVIGIAFAKGPEALGDTAGVETSWLQARGFDGAAGSSHTFNLGEKTIVVLGVGQRDEIDGDGLRRAAATFTRASWKFKTAELDLSGARPSSLDVDRFGQALAEGVLLAAYRFDEYKSSPDAPMIEHVGLVGATQDGIDRGVRISEAVCLARDLVNQPAGVMTPRRLAEVASEVAEANDLAITVLDEDAIDAERLGGLRGVSMGSSEPPRLVELTYEPTGGFERTVALVGKGITFDSGGLSLKPPDAMMTMKTDMSGAAAVIAAMSTLSVLSPRVRVIGIVCASENLPGPRATKPGDVLRIRNGKTVEVLNTDAEGRLVLADGLSLAVEAGVDAIVDIATLTGACMVALGSDIAGLMSNDDVLRNAVQQAAHDAGEQVWHLPLPKRYRKHIDSEIADIKNIGAGKGSAGALSAGLFLQEFVGDKPWVHLDIAGPARAESDDGYTSRGATGFGVRTLIELVTGYDVRGS